MEVLRRLRQSMETPVIMLTAKDEVTDIVMGLDLGANDYMTKPFAIEELLARIRGALKRTKVNSQYAVLQIGPLQIDLDKHMVRFEQEIIDLTKKEYDLLLYLAQNKNIVLPREKILQNVWDYEYTGETNTVDVHIRYLRSKIDDHFKTKLIYTVRGVGYVLKYE